MKPFPRSLWLALALCGGLLVAGPSKLSAAAFARGADIGWLSQFEARGVKWRNPAGVPQEPLQILTDFGLNAIRLRVFVHPPADGMVNGFPLGFCDPASVVAMAVRAQKAGFSRIMIDFHYSDTWADPGKQPKPSAWADHSFEQLMRDVYQHTHDVMEALVKAGVRPEWVQVGNEINNGMIWPDGRTQHFEQLTQLINRGYEAVKAVDPTAMVIVHLANGHDNAAFRWWFDQFFRCHGQCDVIGLSYYPHWAKVDYRESIDGLAKNLDDLAQRYGKPVMVCEVGGVETEAANSYALLGATIAAVQAVPDGKGLGVFYWEPEANASVTGGYPLGATVRVAPNDLQFTKAMTAFAERGAAPAAADNNSIAPARAAEVNPPASQQRGAETSSLSP